MSAPPRVRPAAVDDVEALVRLRAVLMGAAADDPGYPAWVAACRAAFRERIPGDPRFRAVVAEDDSGQVVAGGVGMVEPWLPRPTDLAGLRGHISSMCTLPHARRRGHARAVLDELLAWFTEQGVHRVHLWATPMGEPLYRAAGFTEPHGRPLTRYSHPAERPPPR